MPLAEGQVSVRGLVMGDGTPYIVRPGFNPFRRSARAHGSGPRAWGHGGWSGAEWSETAVVPLPVMVHADGYDEWEAAHQALAAAFAPVGDSGEEVELRFRLGSREYLMFGRPRMVEPESRRFGVQAVQERCAFVALDPLIYDAAEQSAQMGLPEFAGGLSVPHTVPHTVPGFAVDGFADVENIGTAPTGLRLRVDGPVSEPRVTLQGSDGSVRTLRVLFDLDAGQWLEIDTSARTGLLQGLPQASRRGQVTGEWPLLPPGVSRLLFRAAEENDVALLSASWRSAWW